MAEAAQSFLRGATLDAPGPNPPGVHASRRSLRIAPNPVARSTTIRGEGWTSGDQVEIGVYDLAGRRVAAGVTGVIHGAWQATWSAIVGERPISKGVYFVRASDRHHQTEQRVLVL